MKKTTKKVSKKSTVKKTTDKKIVRKKVVRKPAVKASAAKVKPTCASLPHSKLPTFLKGVVISEGVRKRAAPNMANSNALYTFLTSGDMNLKVIKKYLALEMTAPHPRPYIIKRLTGVHNRLMGETVSKEVYKLMGMT